LEHPVCIVPGTQKSVIVILIAAVIGAALGVTAFYHGWLG
jgi:hypothetical protein